MVRRTLLLSRRRGKGGELARQTAGLAAFRAGPGFVAKAPRKVVEAGFAGFAKVFVDGHGGVKAVYYPTTRRAMKA